MAVFLYQMAHDSLPAVWMFYTQHKFGWGADEVGYSLTFVGVMTVIVMGGFTGKVVPLLGERRAIIMGFLIMSVGFLGYAFASQGWMIYVAIVIGSLGGIANPTVQSVMSRQVGPSSQGELQGALACIRSIAAVRLAGLHDPAVHALLQARSCGAVSGRAIPGVRGAGVLVRADLRPRGEEIGTFLDS